MSSRLQVLLEEVLVTNGSWWRMLWLVGLGALVASAPVPLDAQAGTTRRRARRAGGHDDRVP